MIWFVVAGVTLLVVYLLMLLTVRFIRRCSGTKEQDGTKAHTSGSLGLSRPGLRSVVFCHGSSGSGRMMFNPNGMRMLESGH
jgi:hypothetical protein